MRVVIRCIAIIAILASALSVNAVGKITVDPNTLQAQTDIVEKTDSRLARNVVYEAKKKNVASILADLTELTGVTLYAGHNKLDWQVRDRKMNIFATDIPLVSLMNSIARVMKFKWSKSEKDGIVSYRLYMDRQALLDAESTKYRQDQRYEQQLIEKRTQLLDSLVSTEEGTAEENSYLNMLMKSGFTPALNKLLAENPNLKEVLASGQELVLTGASMSPNAYAPLKDIMAGMHHINNYVVRNQKPFPENINMDEVVLRINGGRQDLAGNPMGGVFIGGIKAIYHNQEIGMSLLDPNSGEAKALGDFVAAMVSKEDDPESTRAKKGEMVDTNISNAVAKEVARHDIGEAVIEHAEIPELKRKIKLEVKENRLTAVEGALAKAAEISVVADWFSDYKYSAQIPNGEVDIRNVLDNIANGYRYNWDVQNNIIELRDRDWFKKRENQIPDEWIARWIDAFRKKKTLDIDELAQIARLTIAQINMNLIEQDDLWLPRVADVVFPNRDILRLYAALDAKQKLQIFNANGLSLNELEPAQWQWVQWLISRRNGAYLSNSSAQILLFGTQKKHNEKIAYEFTITTTDGLEPLKWQFVTPGYIEQQLNR